MVEEVLIKHVYSAFAAAFLAYSGDSLALQTLQPTNQRRTRFMITQSYVACTVYCQFLVDISTCRYAILGPLLCYIGPAASDARADNRSIV